MDIAVVYNQPGGDGDASDQDVLVQRDEVTRVLTDSGHRCAMIPCDLDLEALRGKLGRDRYECVFNLVEALGGTDRLAALVPMLLESIHMPYTGASASTLFSTLDKVAVKQLLTDSGLPTPDWLPRLGCTTIAPGRYIIKARFEHASVGIDDRSVVEVANQDELECLLEQATATTGIPMFAEQFIDGREFNVSVIENAAGEPEVLPVAEIDFSSFPDGKPRIVGYDAKWRDASFEFNSTPRAFGKAVVDQCLHRQLRSLSEASWRHFSLTGYARVDYRVDAQGSPFILEINTNPCLSPDAGFQAALCEAGFTFSQACNLIVQCALRARR